MKELLKSWNAYWFHPAPLVDLAICRIVIVGYQLFELFRRDLYNTLRQLSELPGFVYDPLPVLHLLIWPFGWTYRPPVEVLLTVFWITLVAGILSLIGLKTTFNLVAFAVGNVFLQAFAYSFGEFHHNDPLMMIALTILCLSPAGRIFSIDDLWRRVRLNSQRGKFVRFNIVDKKSLFTRWPLLLVQWMFALVYLSAAWSKLVNGGLDWMNGYTLQYYLLQDGIRWDLSMGIWLSQYHSLAWLLSWIVILFEGTFFLVIIFPRLRWLYIPLGLAFYTGIEATMSATFFTHMALYVVFVDWTAILKTLSRRLESLHSRIKAEILFDGKCPLCIRSMTVLRYCDWFNHLRFSDFESRCQSLVKSHPGISPDDCRREMHVLLPDGSVRKGYFAFREILWYLPPLWPLLVPFYLVLAPVVGPRLYGFIASRRFRFNQCTSDACLLHHGGQ